MENKVLSDLQKKFNLMRMALLASLVFFLIALFALVSHWDTAIPIILFACVFRLAAGWFARRNYSNAWMQAIAAASARLTLGKDAVYTAREHAESAILTNLGFAPDVTLVPNTLMFHVLRGTLRGHPVALSETAFVRAGGARRSVDTHSVAGTLVTAENALPPAEKWVLLWKGPLEKVIPMSDYDHSAWQALPAPSFMTGAVCYSAAGDNEHLEQAAKALLPCLGGQCAALAAADGRLSLILPGDFYASKPDLSKAPTEESLQGRPIMGLDAMQKMLAAVTDGKE